MSDVFLGNKLKVSTIDIVPHNVDHYDEYLMVDKNETKYELKNISDIKSLYNISYNRNGTFTKNHNFNLLNKNLTSNINQDNTIIVTFNNHITKTFDSCQTNDLKEGNVFINNEGIIYSIHNTIYKQAEEPSAQENDMWVDIKSEPVEYKKYVNGVWEYYEDTFLGTITNENTFIEQPTNYNYTLINNDTQWIIESKTLNNYNNSVIINHNLNIDILTYKVDCYLKYISTNKLVKQEQPFYNNNQCGIKINNNLNDCCIQFIIRKI